MREERQRAEAAAEKLRQEVEAKQRKQAEVEENRRLVLERRALDDEFRKKLRFAERLLIRAILLSVPYFAVIVIANIQKSFLNSTPIVLRILLALPTLHIIYCVASADLLGSGDLAESDRFSTEDHPYYSDWHPHTGCLRWAVGALISLVACLADAIAGLWLWGLALAALSASFAHIVYIRFKWYAPNLWRW